MSRLLFLSWADVRGSLPVIPSIFNSINMLEHYWVSGLMPLITAFVAALNSCLCHRCSLFPRLLLSSWPGGDQGGRVWFTAGPRWWQCGSMFSFISQLECAVAWSRPNSYNSPAFKKRSASEWLCLRVKHWFFLLLSLFNVLLFSKSAEGLFVLVKQLCPWEEY